VVDLGQEGDLPAFEPMDQVELPERPGAVQRTAEDARHLVRQLLVAPRCGQSELPHVEVEVEVRVVDPVRVIQAERHLGEAPAEWGQQRQPLDDQLLDVVEVDLVARRGGWIEHRDPRDMAGLPRRLHGQELRVKTRELSHRHLPRDLGSPS